MTRWDGQSRSVARRTRAPVGPMPGIIADKNQPLISLPNLANGRRYGYAVCFMRFSTYLEHNDQRQRMEPHPAFPADGRDQ